MIKTDNDILYNACMNVVGFDRSQKFRKWFHERYNMQQHHIFGSYTGIKTSDYCSIPLTPKQHEKAEKDKSNYAVSCFPLLLTVMIAYIKFLEGEK